MTDATDATPGSGPPTPPAPPTLPTPPVAPRRPAPRILGLHPADFFVPASAVGAVIGSAGAYYTVTSERAPSVVTSFTAWHGFLGWFGVVLAVAAAASVVAGLLGVVEIVPARSVALVLCLAAAAYTLASYVVTPGDLCADVVYLEGDCAGAVVDRGWGFGRTLIGTGGGAFVALYWYLLDRRGRT